MEDKSGKDVKVWNYSAVSQKRHHTILHILCVCEYQTGFAHIS